MIKVLTFNSEEEYIKFRDQDRGLREIGEAYLVAYKCDNDTWYKIKSRNSSRENVTTDILNQEIISLHTPKFKTQIIDPSRAYLFSIESDKDNTPQLEVTALIRSIEFESRTKLKIEFLHDEKNTFEKFITNNKFFFICLLSRTGEVTKRIAINIKNYYGGYPSKLSHEATAGFVTMTATLELEQYV